MPLIIALLSWLNLLIVWMSSSCRLPYFRVLFWIRYSVWVTGTSIYSRVPVPPSSKNVLYMHTPTVGLRLALRDTVCSMHAIHTLISRSCCWEHKSHVIKLMLITKYRNDSFDSEVELIYQNPEWSMIKWSSLDSSMNTEKQTGKNTKSSYSNVNAIVNLFK